MQTRNEAAFLPGCLAHVRPWVDGFVALDDGSTDGTGAVLAAEPRMLDVITRAPREPHVWDEPRNKRALLRRAAALGADWVLCVDADERWEACFLERLYDLAASLARDGVWWTIVWLRELWNRPDQYRCDGGWGRKERGRFFRLPEQVESDDKPLHGPWEPPSVRRRRFVRLDHDLYHLKMIRAEDRIARRDFYKRLDPQCAFQPQGYDYLTDETGIVLKAIAPGKEYAYLTLPPKLQSIVQLRT
jgi:glycosyltransferase involved in cell wall biosynthesis